VRRLALVAALASAAFAPGACAQPAQGGRYDAQLCVATKAAEPPTCGTADVEVVGRQVSVRVADIVYRLALHSAQLDVETMHGRMQIDEFSAPYRWTGDTLRFSDAAKNVDYEVRLGAKKAGTSR
jgi:hypothetical protein